MIAVWVQAQTATLESAKGELAELAVSYPPGVRAAAPLVCGGLAEREIIDVAKRAHVDLIIMGSKESTPLGRLFIGSTADAVMNFAPCSVLLVRHSTG
jgi:nucleotide-binding universal stress UspA family protein